MAQDVRPYKSKEQDGQGNEIILRDQQLVEQTSQTTMASGEYFEIVDVDGRMAKIPKDNMIGVVREALGSLLNGLADQTTVTKALTLNGDTLGASTAATLASVLGAQSVATLSGNTDPNELPTNIPISAYFGVLNGNNHGFSSSATFLVQIVVSSTRIMQMGLYTDATAGNSLYIRRYYNSSWNNWDLIGPQN